MKSQALVPFKAAASYEFGPILIDVASRKILRNGDSIVVPSKAFDALVYLAAHPDRTVTKDELIGAVWENMFVSEDSLFHSISVLRRTLGDDSTHPQLIITVPRMGYRLRGPVRKVFGAPSDASEDADRSAATEREAALPIQPPIRGARWRWSTLWMLLSIPLVLFLLAREFLAARVLPGSTTILLTQNAPERATIASGGILSPDSRYMVFVAHDQKSVKARLYLKQMDSPELRLLAGTEGASHPFWSPESNVIGFFANGELKTIDLRGDILKAIAAVPVSAGGGTWSSDGTILFSDWQTGLYRVDSTDGRVIRVSTVNRSSGENVENLPQFLPDGRHFLFHLLSSTAGQTGSYVGSLDSPKRIRLLTQSSSPVVYSPSGHLLYVQGGILRPNDSTRCGSK
jgi:DNA-binding winged helix-turn-helix (wHTH) protein